MIEAYCVDDITIKRVTRGAWGEPSSKNIAVKGYIDWTTKLVRDFKGEQVIAATAGIVAVATVYLPYDGLLTHEDRLIINSVEYSIINIVEGKDFSRSHYEVHIR